MAKEVGEPIDLDSLNNPDFQLTEELIAAIANELKKPEYKDLSDLIFNKRFNINSGDYGKEKN